MEKLCCIVIMNSFDLYPATWTTTEYSIYTYMWLTYWANEMLHNVLIEAIAVPTELLTSGTPHWCDGRMVPHVFTGP